MQRPVIVGLDASAWSYGLGRLIVAFHLRIDVAADGGDEERVAAAAGRLPIASSASRVRRCSSRTCASLA